MGSIAIPPAEPHLKETTFEVPLAPYPRSSSLPLPTSPEEVKAIVDKSINDLSAILQSEDYLRLPNVFASTSYWRDHLGLSKTKLSTLNGPGEITALIKSEGKECNITSLDISGTPEVANLDPKGTVKCIVAFITFETHAGSGRGLVRLIRDVENADEWRIYVIFTTLSDLKATPFLTGNERPENAKPDDAPETENWLEWWQRKREFLDEEPTVVIVGAGHSGLMMAARLKMLGVSSLIVEKNQRTGDIWRLRYHDLVLHDPSWMNAFPYLNYPPTWPILTPKDKIADFLTFYETALDLNVWTSTQIVESEWNGESKEWSIVLERYQDGKVSRRTLHPHHIIQATGLNGEPQIPSIPGMETFEGPITHSTQFTDGTSFANKKVIVVGTGTSGHDISQGLHRHGATVTIVQRSPTFVMSLSSVHNLVRTIYNEQAVLEDVDIKTMSNPSTLFKRIGSDGSKLIFAPANRQLWKDLEAVGFKTISDEEKELPSLLPLTISRAGGFYIDIGCSSLITSGQIAVKSSPSITRLTPTGMVFADGEEISADAIVFATGYSNGRVRTRKVFGDEVADRISPIFGFDEQGEIRGAWRRSGQEGFWVAAGAFWISRYYSKLLALQIKMVEEGLAGL